MIPQSEWVGSIACGFCGPLLWSSFYFLFCFSLFSFYFHFGFFFLIGLWKEYLRYRKELVFFCAAVLHGISWSMLTSVLVLNTYKEQCKVFPISNLMTSGCYFTLPNFSIIFLLSLLQYIFFLVLSFLQQINCFFCFFKETYLSNVLVF